MSKAKALLNEFRKEADLINETYGLGDEDHDTALERGHIYDLMKRYKIKTLEDVNDAIEKLPVYTDKISVQWIEKKYVKQELEKLKL